MLHQVLQWHRMLTGASLDSVANLRINTLADGLFHASTCAFAAAGLAVPWRSARRTHLRWTGKLQGGLAADGLRPVQPGRGRRGPPPVRHLFGVHHVNETALRDEWIFWDIGFLLWGAAMLAGGRLPLRAGKRET